MTFEVLNSVSGLTVDFENKPDVSHKPNQFADKELATVAEETKKLLAKEIIKELSHEKGEIISPIHILREKPDGPHRLILNLKETNKFVENFLHFKMETITTVLSLVRPNCHMGSIDIKDACIPVCEGDKNTWSLFLMVNFSSSPVFQMGCVLGQGNLPNFLMDHLPLLEK